MVYVYLTRCSLMCYFKTKYEFSQYIPFFNCRLPGAYTANELFSKFIYRLTMYLHILIVLVQSFVVAIHFN